MQNFVQERVGSAMTVVCNYVYVVIKMMKRYISIIFICTVYCQQRRKIADIQFDPSEFQQTFLRTYIINHGETYDKQMRTNDTRS